MPGMCLGMFRSKVGNFWYSAFASVPSWMASMIFRYSPARRNSQHIDQYENRDHRARRTVYGSGQRLPTPNLPPVQPVFNSQQLAFCFVIRSASMAA
jgi:hypothetical protein